MLQPRSLKQSVAMGLAVCAIAPATAAAMPAIDGQGVAAGGGPSVSAKDFAPQNLTAPDQVDRGAKATPVTTKAGPPQRPLFRAMGKVDPATAKQSDDVDTGVLIGLGGAAFVVLAGGLGLAGRKRLQTARPHQLA
jgi:hypothetical protein